MYVSIDKQHLLFLHKHEHQRIVSQLVNIEAPHLHTAVFPCNQASDFGNFTDWELKKLYENTTGSKAQGFYRPGLEMLCFTAAQALTETKANALEVDLQSRTISFNDKTIYAYQFGDFKPRPVAELFEITALRASANTTAEQAAATLRPAAITYMHRAPNAAPGHDRPPAAPRVYTIPAAGATPRGAGREKIWEAADRMWEAAGKPMKIQTVLDLRKRIMDELEKDGIKRTSASSELGNWMKSRVLSA